MPSVRNMAQDLGNRTDEAMGVRPSGGSQIPIGSPLHLLMLHIARQRKLERQQEWLKALGAFGSLAGAGGAALMRSSPSSPAPEAPSAPAPFSGNSMSFISALGAPPPQYGSYAPSMSAHNFAAPNSYAALPYHNPYASLFGGF